MQLQRTLRTILANSLLIVVVSLFLSVTILSAPTYANSTSPQGDSHSQNKTKKPKTTHKKVTKTEVIKFSKKTQNDPTLPKGQTKIIHKGVNGQKKVTYKVTYKDGKATKWQVLNSKTLKKATDQLTAIGTYVAPTPAPSPSTTSTAAPTNQPTCTNGSYVNSAGNTACNPETASSAPAGATAQCRDGTYSFSQSHSGTCSHHGGVAAWL